MSTATSRPLTAPVRARALELHEAGWGPTQIEKILAAEFPDRACPSRGTIWRWANPDAYRGQVERRRALSAANYSGGWPGVCSPEWKIQRMRVLRAAGLSYSAIAAVMHVDFPADRKLTEYLVSTALSTGDETR